MRPLPLSLYVHFPWCEQKCPYCDFNSHPRRSPIPEDRYVSALLSDLDEEASRVDGRTVTSVFLGGGTPSLLGADSVAQLLRGVRSRIDLAADCEISMETNPGSADARRYDGYRAAGVTRLSIGVQSFDDAALARLGRNHDGGQARRAVGWAQRVGFASINVDLMYAVPEQSPAAAVEDVREALAMDVPHLSHYQLTLEPNTAFHRAPPPLPTEEAVEAMESGCRALIAHAGLARYEVSAFARRGHRCRHNLNYWRFGDYIGIGAGAHGKLTDARRGEVVRSVKIRHPRRYLGGAAAGGFVHARRGVDHAELPLEFMLNATRLVDGFGERDYEEATGLPVSSVKAGLEQARRLGLVERSRGRIRPTTAGLRFLHDLQGLFLVPATPGGAGR